MTTQMAFNNLMKTIQMAYNDKMMTIQMVSSMLTMMMMR